MNHKSDTRNDYAERINKVLQYINTHIEEEISIKQLAEISNFSPFHFHRIIRAYLNEPIYAYIVRIRLEIAARLLVFSDQPMNDIAVKIGYDNQTSFNKAFKSRFGITPTEYRENSALRNINFNHLTLNKNIMILDMKPKIKDVKPRKVVYIQNIEQYGGPKMQNSWPKLFEFVKKHKLFSFGMECIGISHDDPDITSPERCRYDSCITVTKDVKPEGEIGFKTIDGGMYAIFHYKGSYDKLGDVYTQITLNWLPSSGYKLREAPCFDVYINDPGKVTPEKLKTDIYIPIEK